MSDSAIAVTAADGILFTCLSCSIAFQSAVEQRQHYRSDFHRYNMKRRVAALPPVSATLFNEKVLERRAETTVMAVPQVSNCEVCNKMYASEHTYRSHLNSKKHKENNVKLSSQTAPSNQNKENDVKLSSQTSVDTKFTAPSSQDLTQAIDDKIAAARSRLSNEHCLFCTNVASSLEANLMHMSTAHSFFIPDVDYLTDITGLIEYLGEKITIGNVCIYCNTRSREFRTLEAVRKHMIDKSHCKVAYVTEKDRLELSDFYDFSSSYPTALRKKKVFATMQPSNESDDEWESVDGDGSTDEVVDKEAPDGESDDDSVPEADSLTYGDTPFELVLPSGARIGHRSLKRYYAQSFSVTSRQRTDDSNSGSALVRKLLADKNSVLVSRKGGYGAFGQGTEVVKARNRGEAREAGRHIREFRDQRRKEEFRTKVGFIHNHQKHYRDPLLQ